MLGGDEPDKRHDAWRRGEAAGVAEFRGNRQGGEVIDAPKTPQTFDARPQRLKDQQCPQILFDAAQSSDGLIDGAQVGAMRLVEGRDWPGLLAQPAVMALLRPSRSGSPTMPEQHREPVARTQEIRVHVLATPGAGALTAIHIPTEHEEAARDLLRCREDIRADLLRARHRLSKCLLRHGRRFTGTKKAWSKRHDSWLREQTWPIAALDQTHRAYLRTVDEAVARLRSVEEDLRTLLVLEPLRPRVERLRCFRGIDDLTALTIAAELGDARRFAAAPRVMAFVGLVPSEHSSGTKQARGAITKTGNGHLRRVLVEAAWHYRHRPFVGAALRRRQVGAPPPIVAQAWTAQERLYRRYHRLAGRGKPNQQVITAVARELTGFVWAALVQ